MKRTNLEEQTLAICDDRAARADAEDLFRLSNRWARRAMRWQALEQPCRYVHRALFFRARAVTARLAADIVTAQQHERASDAAASFLRP